MAFSPAIAGAASATTPATSLLNTGAAQGGDPNGAMTAMVGQIRDIGQSVDDLGASNPSLSQEIGQIKMLLRQMIIKAAQAASTQTPSAEALPVGGQ